MLEIFKYELKYRLRYVSTYLYGILILFMPIFMNIVNIDGSVAINSPYKIYFYMAIIFQFAMVMLAGMVMQAFHKDFETRFKEIIFTQPITEVQYVFGRLLACLFIVFVVAFLSMIVFEVSLKFLSIDPKLILTSKISWYMNPLFLYVLPNLYFMVAFFISIILFTKKTKNLFIAIISVFIMEFLMFYLSDVFVLKKDIFAVLDIFCWSNFFFSTMKWTDIDMNTMQVLLNSQMFINRGVWFVFSSGLLLLAVKKFKFQAVKEKVNAVENFDIQKSSGNSLKIVGFNIAILSYQIFNFKTILHQIFTKFQMNNRIIYKSLIFWWIFVLCVIFLCVALPIGRGDCPPSSMVAGSTISVYFYFMCLIIPFFTGELVWASHEQKFSVIEDTLPFSNLVSFLSQFLTMFVLIIGYAVLSIAIGVIFQLSVGNYNIDMKDYFNIFFLKYIPIFIVFILYAFIIQNNVPHKFLGHFFFVCSVFVRIMVGYLTKHPLLVPYLIFDEYTGIDGFGKNATYQFWMYLYWILVLVFFTGLNVLAWKRGMLQYNLKNILNKLRSKPVIIYHIVLLSLIFTVVAYIFYNTNLLNQYE